MIPMSLANDALHKIFSTAALMFDTVTIQKYAAIVRIAVHQDAARGGALSPKRPQLGAWSQGGFTREHGTLAAPIHERR